MNKLLMLAGTAGVAVVASIIAFPASWVIATIPPMTATSLAVGGILLFMVKEKE